MTQEITAPLFEYMQNGAIIITPNNRLSNQLLHDFFASQNHSVIDKPVCLPYQAFLQQLYQAICHSTPEIDHPVILNAIQGYFLWNQVINDNEKIQEGLFHEVQKAWTNCRHWQIELDHPAFTHSPQTQQFQQWQQAFQQKLTELNALSEEQIVDYVLGFLDKLNYKTIIWACFNHFTPQQQALQEAFSALDCPQYWVDLTDELLSIQHYAAKDSHDEYQQMIQWLKARLAAGDQRIGVVVPELQNQSHQLQRLIQRQLPNDHFNISLGEPLAEYPLIAHALTWIMLDNQTVSNETARLLLQSPYLSGSKSEFLNRAETLQNSKLLKENLFSMKQWAEELKSKTPELARLCLSLNDYPAKDSPQKWVDHFKQRLITLGFPGEYALNSESYQCFQRLEGLFESFLQLTLVSEQLTQSKAFACLHHLAKTTIFQFKQRTTPIVILGLLEAAGCTFDSIWVCGMDDQCLPQKTRLSAFIPIELQRERQMPKALPEKELEYAQLTLRRLQKGAKHSVFSFSRLLGDTPNLPSPLICKLPLYTALPSDQASVSKLQLRDETYTLPLLTGEIASGGTGLLGDQAKCPFRAFAAHRLHAKSRKAITAGPDASERGQILHKIMEKIWCRLGNQKTLLSMPQGELDACITEAINESLERYTGFRRFSFPALMKDVEISRLQTLVEACLDWEKKRPDFTVEAIEKTFEITLAGIDFTIRVDRLDTIGADKWVIDYKTTIPTNKPWNADRPEEPQLLLYALLDENINALLFLQLKAGQLTCSGISEAETELKGLKGLKKGEEWQTLQENWRTQLNTLAEEFQQGHCPPEPNRPTICQQCDFPSLCRVDLT